MITMYGWVKSTTEPTPDLCWISTTVSKVRPRVEPPAPKVTEKNSGFSFASSRLVCSSFAMPSAVLGGKNSKLYTGVLVSILIQ